MASDIARKGIANPIGPASALMLEQFKLIRSRGVGVLQDTAHRRSQTNLDTNRLRA
jgi:isocitrate/isopropylmalate dehydrogenase